MSGRTETVVPGIPVLDLVESQEIYNASLMGVVGVQAVPVFPDTINSLYPSAIGSVGVWCLANGVWTWRITNAVTTVGRSNVILSVPLNRDLSMAPLMPALARRYLWETVVWRDVLTAGSDFSVQICSTNSLRPLGSGSDNNNIGYELASLDSRNAGRWTIRRRLLSGGVATDVLDTGLDALTPRKISYELVLTPSTRRLQIAIDGAQVFATDVAADFPAAPAGIISGGTTLYGFGFVSQGAVGGVCYATGSHYRVDAL